MGRMVARGVPSRSPASEEFLGGELIIMRSFVNCEGGAGVCRTGEDWKNKGEEDGTALPPGA